MRPPINESLKIHSRREFRELLDWAFEETEELARQVPQWSLPKAILGMLQHIRDTTKPGAQPMQKDIDEILPGSLAAKNFEADHEAAYVNLLCHVDFNYGRFPELPE